MTTKAKRKQETVTFVSRSRNQHVVLRPRRPHYERDAGGNVVASGVAGGPVPEGSYSRGSSEESPSGVLFQNWTFATDDPDVIKALREHSEFETKYGWQEAYDASRPKAEEMQEKIATLAASDDADGLRELIEDEESAGDGGRVTVLRPARAALEKLSGSSGAEAAGTTQTKKSTGKSPADESPPAKK